MHKSVSGRYWVHVHAVNIHIQHFGLLTVLRRCTAAFVKICKLVVCGVIVIPIPGRAILGRCIRRVDPRLTLRVADITLTHRLHVS